MADGRHHEKLEKSPYLSRGFERFRQNLARRRSSTLLSVTTVNNLKFPESKMAAAAILKNQKSAISPERFNVSLRNLAR